MILTCNNCESQLNHSLSCIPLKWRDPIVSSLCRLFEDAPRHCKKDFDFYLCDLPSKWREELVAMICHSFTISSCDYDCQACRNLFCSYLTSLPEEWREKIQVIVCDIIQTKGCTQPPCVTYLITPFFGINQSYDYNYLDCYRERIEAIASTDPIIICAIEGSLNIDPRFNIVKIHNTCDLATDDCLCFTIVNIEWETPHVVPHKISYEDCNGGVFTDVDMEGIPYIQICAKPLSIVSNFAYSAMSMGTCIDTCLVGACYQFLAVNILEDEEVTFSYQRCTDSQQTPITLQPLQSTIFCTSIELFTSSNPNLDITAIGSCG